jgi:hypothetical protein
MFNDDPLLLTLHLTTNFSELIGMLWADLDNDCMRDDALSRVVDSLQRWWEGTRPISNVDPPLTLLVPEMKSWPQAGDILVDRFGDFVGERLSELSSEASAARLTVAAHIGGLAIHLWRHRENLYEMSCVAELAGRIPGELIACAIGRLDGVPASVLRSYLSYLPGVPIVSREHGDLLPIGWNTGHHVASICAECGWFGDTGGRPMSSLENGATMETTIDVAHSGSTTEASDHEH